MPGQGKDLAAFQQDDATCRQFALQANGYASPTDAANQSVTTSAVLGTVLGAAAGAAIGAAAGNPAAGAAIGAGSGLVLGTASGAGAGQYAAGSVQYAYDVSYMQCMTARGNSVPQTASAQYAYGYGGYPYPYPAPYPYPYPYAYPYYPGFIGGGGVFFDGRHRHHW